MNSLGKLIIDEGYPDKEGNTYLSRRGTEVAKADDATKTNEEDTIVELFGTGKISDSTKLSTLFSYIQHAKLNQRDLANILLTKFNENPDKFGTKTGKKDYKYTLFHNLTSILNQDFPRSLLEEYKSSNSWQYISLMKNIDIIETISFIGDLIKSNTYQKQENNIELLLIANQLKDIKNKELINNFHEILDSLLKNDVHFTEDYKLICETIGIINQ